MDSSADASNPPPGATPDEPDTSQVKAISSPSGEVVWPEDPLGADGDAADDDQDPAATSPGDATPSVPMWPGSPFGEPSPSRRPADIVKPLDDDPHTTPFQTQPAAGSWPPKAASDPSVSKTVPPASAPPTAPPEPAPVEADGGDDDDDDDDHAEATVTPAAAATVDETKPPASRADDAVLETATPIPRAAPEPEAAPTADEAEEPAAEAAGEQAEAAAEPAVYEAEPRIDEPVSEPDMPVVMAEAAEHVEPAEPAEPAEPTVESEEPAEARPKEGPVPEPEPAPTVTPAPAASPRSQSEEERLAAEAAAAFAASAAATAPANPPIPSWAPKLDAPRPEGESVDWPGSKLPSWAPIPGGHGVDAPPERVRISSTTQPGPATQPAQAPTPPAAAASRPPTSAPQPAPAPPTGSRPPAAGGTSSKPPGSASWEVVQTRQEPTNVFTGPSAEDKSYAEWFAWAKRSGAPASACHAAAQGAFRALSSGQDMATAVKWATVAMASPPGLVGQARQLYCAWFSLGNIDLQLPTPQAHIFATGAIQALENGADSMVAHQAGLAAVGIVPPQR